MVPYQNCFMLSWARSASRKWNGVDCGLLANAPGLRFKSKSSVIGNVGFPVAWANIRLMRPFRSCRKLHMLWQVLQSIPCNPFHVHSRSDPLIRTMSSCASLGQGTRKILMRSFTCIALKEPSIFVKNEVKFVIFSEDFFSFSL